MRGYLTDPAATAGVRLADDLPEPTPAQDEVVLQVLACSINPGELSLIRSRPHGWRPGQDVAGVVIRVAPDGSGPALHTRVVARAHWQGWAERVAVPVHVLAPLDDRVTFETAATLPISGLTALRALRLGNSVLGRDVLITGATGGVGNLAVQLARLSGARVTAHVRDPRRHPDTHALGTRVVDTLDHPDLGPFHLVLDGVGGPLVAPALRTMAPGATLVLYGGAPIDHLRLRDFSQGAANATIVGFVSETPEHSKGADLALLCRLVAEGLLVPRITSTGSWTTIPDSLLALNDGTSSGKHVFTVS